MNFPKHHDDYLDMPDLKIDNNACTSYPNRQKRMEKCIFCGNIGTSPLAEWFKQKQLSVNKRSRKTLVADKMVRCGHESCSIRFHYSCITNAKPMPRWNAQYLILKQNNGVLLCPDHFCDLCFTDTFQRSASMGELVKVENQVRAFHEKCKPAGSYYGTKLFGKDKKTRLILAPSTSHTDEHFPFCCGCAEGKNEELIECQSCVQSFHLSCHGSYFGNQNDLKKDEKKNCENCMFNTQMRVGEGVLVFTNTVFRAARIMSGGRGAVIVEVLSTKTKITVPLKSLFCPYPRIANGIFNQMALSKSYKKHQNELVLIKAIFEQRAVFKPNIVRKIPSFKCKYQMHKSVHRYMSGEAESLIPVNGNVEIVTVGKFGFGMIAVMDLNQKIPIGEYIGELISKPECDRRKNLGEDSHDSECMFYTFESDVFVGGKKRKIYIDGAQIGNELA
uniref:SET domain-containing protein n=2 Tax=Caenorhabditis tropicalis TaxID=1561998 RepID=A0A1I7U1N0_9PELO